MSVFDRILAVVFLSLLGEVPRWLLHGVAQSLEGIEQMIRGLLGLLDLSLTSYYFLYGLAVPVAVLNM